MSEPNLGRRLLAGGSTRVHPLLRNETWRREPDAINRGWRYTIETGKPDGIEAADTIDEDVPPIAQRTAAAVRACRDFARADQIGDDIREIADAFDAARTTDEYNEVLDDLYDWGDMWRVIVK